MYEMLFKLAIETLMHCSVFLIVFSWIMSCCTIAYVSRLFKVLTSNIDEVVITVGHNDKPKKKLVKQAIEL